MGFTMRAYPLLKSEFAAEVRVLINEHRAQSVDTLNHPRRGQIQFLNQAIRELDVVQMDATAKARILTGLFLMILKEIEGGYKWLPESRSGLVNSLIQVLGITKNNEMDPNSAVIVVKEAMKFIEKLVFEDGDTTHPLLEEHPFSKCEEFKLNDYWNLATDMIAKATKDIYAVAKVAMETSVSEREEQERRLRGGNSFLSNIGGMLGYGAKKPVEVPIINEDERVLKF